MAARTRRTGAPLPVQVSAISGRQSLLVRVPNTQGMMEFWGPRLGASGAFRFSLYVWASFLVKPVALVAFVSLLVAGRVHGTTAQTVAIVFLVLAFALALGMLIMPVLARRAAS